MKQGMRVRYREMKRGMRASEGVEEAFRVMGCTKTRCKLRAKELQNPFSLSLQPSSIIPIPSLVLRAQRRRLPMRLERKKKESPQQPLDHSCFPDDLGVTPSIVQRFQCGDYIAS